MSLAIAVLANLVFLCGIAVLSRPHDQPGRRSPDAVGTAPLLVRLIDPPPAPTTGADPPSNPVRSAPRADGATRTRPSPAPGQRDAHGIRAASPQVSSAADASTAPASEPHAPESALHLFKPDGSVAIPEADVAAPAASVPFPEGPRRTAHHDPFIHRNLLNYQPSLFANAWAAPEGETLGGEILRRSVTEKTWQTPWGTQITCMWLLMMGGCSWGSAPRGTIEAMQRDRVTLPPLRVGENARSPPVTSEH